MIIKLSCCVFMLVNLEVALFTSKSKSYTFTCVLFVIVHCTLYIVITISCAVRLFANYYEDVISCMI